jgi:dethiobiotin synthetase
MAVERSFFITGTDTEIGKTTITAGLITKAIGMGYTAVGLKPVAAGKILIDGESINEDVHTLRSVSVPSITAKDICAIELFEACAPHIAAQKEGVSLSSDVIINHVRAGQRFADFSFVEGVGGFKIPLENDWWSSDLARDLNLPVILVVGIRLGCINHAILTSDSIKSLGLELRGWVGTVVDSEFENIEENVDAIGSAISSPCIGIVPFLTKPSPARVSEFLSLDLIL